MPPVTCVLDTSTVANTVAIELGAKTLLEAAEEVLNVRIPHEVMQEVERKHRDNPTNWDKPHRFVARIGASRKHAGCLNYVESWFGEHGGKKYPHVAKLKNLGKGERGCSALALAISFKRRQSFLNLVIFDDQQARFAMGEFLRRQGIGLAICTPELILLLMNRFRGVSPDQALKALNDYYQLNPEPSTIRAKDSYVKEVRNAWHEMLYSRN